MGATTLSAVRGPVGADAKWITYRDGVRHFRIDYPVGWKLNTQLVSVAHYTDVFAALNSAGKEGLTVQDVKVEPDHWQLSPRLIAQQVPTGTAYVQVAWFEGPFVRQFGPEVREVKDVDLPGLLGQSQERRDGELIWRTVHFTKWGHDWSVATYLHLPVTSETRDELRRVLASFRFEGVPAGDELWALGLAAKHLPPEADPERYTRTGGSSEYYCSAEVHGDEVTVTFTKHVGNSAPQRWRYQVTATGEVLPVMDN